MPKVLVIILFQIAPI